MACDWIWAARTDHSAGCSAGQCPWPKCRLPWRYRRSVWAVPSIMLKHGSMHRITIQRITEWNAKHVFGVTLKAGLISGTGNKINHFSMKLLIQENPSRCLRTSHFFRILIKVRCFVCNTFDSNKNAVYIDSNSGTTSHPVIGKAPSFSSSVFWTFSA